MKKISINILTLISLFLIFILKVDAMEGDSVKLKRYRILTFGDSTTATRSTISAVYSQTLAEILKDKGVDVEVVNCGIPGSHSGKIEDNDRHKVRHAMDRFESDILSQNPDFTIVCFGINDSYIDDKESMISRISLEKYQENIERIIQGLKENNSQIILMTPNGYSSNMAQYQTLRTNQYVNVVREVAREHNLPLIDQWAIYQSMRERGDDVDKMLLDDVHPNDIWHTKLANLLSEQIINMLKNSPMALYSPNLAEIKEYRIPSLLTTPSGTIIAMADARVHRQGDIPNNVDIAIRRSLDNGASWSDVEIIVDFGEKPEGYDIDWGVADAAMVYDNQTSTLWAIFTMGQGVGIATSKAGYDGHTCQLHTIYSKDDGKTWSGPIDISRQVKLPTMKFIGSAPGVGIQTSDGDLVFAIYTTDQNSGATMTPYLVISSDNGKSWRLSNTWGDRETSVTETQIVELPDGKWMVNSRNHYEKYRLISLSDDKGESWSDIEFDYELPCPTCMATLIAIDHPNIENQKLLIFANPSNQKERKNGAIQISDDNGKTWRWKRAVNDTWYSYSCLTLQKDNKIGLLYEGEEGKIYYRSFTLCELTNGDLKF